MRKFRNYKNTFAKGLIVVMFSATAFSCIEDTGNYDYKAINRIEISGIEEGYTVPLGSRLQITPELKFSIGESADTYKYEWHFCGVVVFGSSYKSSAVISEERNLDIIVGKPIEADGTYRIMYCVTNLTTGVRYETWFNLFVRNKTTNGYIMLCERENNSFDIDLISVYNDTLTQYHNMLELYDSHLPRTGIKPLDLVCYPDYPSPMIGDSYTNGKKFALWILTDQSTERIRLENFDWEPEFNISSISTIPDKFLQGGKLKADKMNAAVSSTNNTSGSNYVLFNGNWYWYNWAGRTYFYMTPINTTSVTASPYKAAPYICMRTASSAVVFNETDNRFEWQNAQASSGNSDTKLRTNRFTNDPAIFNWENPNYRLVYMDNRTYSQGFAVVKNVASNKYELLVMNLNAGSAATKVSQAEFPTLPAGVSMEDFKFIAYHNNQPYLFCATEDKVYRINTDVMQNWADVTSVLVPSGHKISKLKSSAIRFAGSNRIVVATYNPNGQAGQNGQLALYDVNSASGDLTIGTGPVSQKADGEYNADLKWTGFGKIINVDYKEPK